MPLACLVPLAVQGIGGRAPRNYPLRGSGSDEHAMLQRARRRRSKANAGGKEGAMERSEPRCVEQNLGLVRVLKVQRDDTTTHLRPAEAKLESSLRCISSHFCSSARGL